MTREKNDSGRNDLWEKLKSSEWDTVNIRRENEEGDCPINWWQ